MKKIWSDEAWDDYLYWQTQDKKTLKRINKLIKDIERGKGNPSLKTLEQLCTVLGFEIELKIKRLNYEKH